MYRAVQHFSITISLTRIVKMQVPELELFETTAGNCFGFELEINTPLHQGLYFDNYQQLLNHPIPREAKTIQSSFVRIIIGKDKNITAMQNELLNCKFVSPESEIGLFNSFFQFITGWYNSPFWIQKDLETDYSKLAPPPEIPLGYYIEDFSRIREIYLSQKSSTIGAIIEVAWSEYLIGVRVNSDSDNIDLEPVGTVEKVWV